MNEPSHIPHSLLSLIGGYTKTGKIKPKRAPIGKKAFFDLAEFDQIAQKRKFRHMFLKYVHITVFLSKYGKLSL
jgi:hypothetical protein